MPENVEFFMEAAVQLASEFLSCGGPVTRLEVQLSAAGSHLGCNTTVHATPSAITVYCQIPDRHESYARGGRIHSFGVDLGRLTLVDNVLGRFARGEIPPNQVLIEISESKNREAKPRALVQILNVFGIGTGAALFSGITPLQALGCGLISSLIQLLVIGAGRILNLSPLFADFLSCFLAFLIATLGSRFLETPAQLLAIGTLVYVVPGLLMTTAISEIVDQNYISGTIRLLKALSTFMAMALAYFLAVDMGHTFAIEFQTVPLDPNLSPTLAARCVGSALVILCAAFDFRASLRSVPAILFCGLSGALVYFTLQTQSNLVAPHFFAAFVIGLISYILSRHYGHPSQIYSVPSVLVLAPGMLALSSFGYGLQDNSNLPPIVRAALISLAIVFGLASSRIPIRRALDENSIRPAQ